MYRYCCHVGCQQLTVSWPMSTGLAYLAPVQHYTVTSCTTPVYVPILLSCGMSAADSQLANSTDRYCCHVDVAADSQLANLY
ncbi:hypothetical protein J6590_009781 [Homalodisca vitripennis]|nr:hypothetical protein J6590_009781 [Homalodisca vitripennis]